jgi:hypothetical protein
MDNGRALYLKRHKFMMDEQKAQGTFALQRYAVF